MTVLPAGTRTKFHFGYQASDDLCSLRLFHKSIYRYPVFWIIIPIRKHLSYRRTTTHSLQLEHL